MSIITWFKSLFGESKTPIASSTTPSSNDFPRGPLGLGISRIVKIDEIMLDGLEGKINLPKPDALQQSIYSHGIIEVNHGTKFHRFYLDDDATWLQVVTNGEGLAGVENLALFFYVNGETPTSQKELDRLVGPQSLVGLPTYLYEGKEYKREWGSELGQTSLFNFEEDVSNAIGESYHLSLASILYKRDIEGTDRSEFVLITVEDAGNDEITVSTAIGISILQSDITVI